MVKVAVRVAEARNVPKMDTVGNTDPYIKLVLGKQKFQTKTIPNTLAPKWDEEFEFTVVSYETDVLILEMWDKDVACDDAISFKEFKIAKMKPGVIIDSWHEFTPSGPKTGGEVRVVLHVMRATDTRWRAVPWIPSMLKLTIHGARDLAKMDTVGHSDPYVTFGLRDSPRRDRTPTVQNTESPTWEHAAEFLLTDPAADVLEFLVRDEDVSKDDDMATCAVPVSKFAGGMIIATWFPLTPVKGVKKGGEVKLSGQIAEAPGY